MEDRTIAGPDPDAGRTDPGVASHHVEVSGLSKRFGGVQALLDINLAVDLGTIHGLVGENGAGKSTLAKLIAGVLRPDAGEIRVRGRPVQYRNPRDALADGITIIAQELMLQPHRSVAENVFLGIEEKRMGMVSRQRTRARFEALAEAAGFDLPADALVRRLPIALQQQVEILRALARNADLIIMDEPTAALTADEAETLFRNIRRLQENGTTIIYVSHFLEEVLALCDTVTVLRDGRLAQTNSSAAETPESLVTAMLGRPFELTFPTRQPIGAEAPVRLSVRGLTRCPAITDITFEIQSGEILGLAGLIGSGRTEVARAIFAADRPEAGQIELDGELLKLRGPADAIAKGIAMLPESRKEQGLLLRRAIVDNVTLPHLSRVTNAGVIPLKRERRNVRKLMERLDVRAPRLSAPIWTLSGGNQQKVLFGKWLFRTPRVLIADEPTRGVDVGAKRAIYELLVSLAAEGLAVLLISSEFEEVLELSHRVLVLHAGRVVAEFDPKKATMEQVLRAAFGRLNADRTEGVSQAA